MKTAVRTALAAALLCACAAASAKPASVWRETAAIAADPAANTPERVAELMQKHRLDCKQNSMDESLTLCRLPQGRPALGLRDGRIAAFAPDARTAAGAKHCRKAGSRSICLAAGAEPEERKLWREIFKTAGQTGKRRR